MAARRAARGRPAGALLNDLRRDASRGWPPGLTVLGGDDVYHLDTAQRELLAALAPPDQSEFSLSVYGEERVDVGAVVAAARSVGMFSPRRVVFVRDAAILEGEPEPLKAYASAPPPGSFLIVRATALDQRRSLHKALARSGRYIQFQAPGAADIGRSTAAVLALAKDKGLKLERSAAALLAEIHGADLYRAASELEKILAWRGPGGAAVDVETIRELVSGGGALTGWEVADAVMTRDRGRALAAARRLVDSGDEPLKIIGGLAWRTRVMLQAKGLTEAGRSPDAALGQAWSFRDGLNEGLRRYSLAELLAFPSELLRADRTLKSRSLDARAVLEDLVDRLTGPDRVEDPR